LGEDGRSLKEFNVGVPRSQTHKHSECHTPKRGKALKGWGRIDEKRRSPKSGHASCQTKIGGVDAKKLQGKAVGNKSEVKGSH